MGRIDWSSARIFEWTLRWTSSTPSTTGKVWLVLRECCFQFHLTLQRLRWNNRIKRDEIHRQVMQTVWCFMNEDNADFDEALKSAIGRRNFLLNRLFKKTPLGWIWRRKGRRGGSRTEGRTLNEKRCFTFWRNGRTCNFYFWFDKKKKLKFESDEVTFII